MDSDKLSDIDIPLYFTNVFHSLTRNRKEDIKANKTIAKNLEYRIEEIILTDNILDIYSALNIAYNYIYKFRVLRILEFVKRYGCYDFEYYDSITDYLSVVGLMTIEESKRNGNLEPSFKCILCEDGVPLMFNKKPDAIVLDWYKS